MTVLREFRLPDLGEGLTESDVVDWRVSPGDRVELNQIIADVETAKALVEIPSPCEGIVARLHAEPGQTVSVGQPLVTFEVAAGVTGEEPPAAQDEALEPNLVGYGAQPEGTFRRTRWNGAAPEPPFAPEDAAPEDVAHADAAPGHANPGHSDTGHSDTGAGSAERPRSTPPVRLLAATLGVDLASVRGTGAGGLVTREDVLAAAEGSREPTVSQAGGVTRIPVTGVRKHTAAAMVASAFTAPHASVWLTVDVTPLMELHGRLAEHRLARGVRITVLALVARAVCIVLRRHPSLNSSWDEAANEIVQYDHVNLGIAAATERGLVVPNIKGADRLGLLDLATALSELTAQARVGRLPLDSVRGGTFTITNIGVFGVEGGTPILNPGEAGILAMGAVQRRPWEHDGAIALRQVMTISLSFDHRLVDGEQGSRFLADLAALLGDPALALVLA